MKSIAGVVALFVSLPIWFFLMYKVLDSVNASELMWFLYWVYVPSVFFCHAVEKVFDGSRSNKS